MDLIVARMLDANANRAREALRVLEDYARFGLNNADLSAQLKDLRHGLAAALQGLDADRALLARDTPNDVGTAIKTESEFHRPALADVVVAAGKRLSEALRVLEETAKTLDPAAAGSLEQIRYRGYALEQTLVRPARQTGRFPAAGLYVLLTEAHCRLPWEATLDAVLAGGAGVVQLREKNLDGGEFLRRARIVAKKCRDVHALAIINDRPDIAVLAGAHGVHLGQTDLPCAQVRKLFGHDLIIGVSTENLDQARQAVRDGATYVGIGPMFATATKERPRLAGPAYAAEAVGGLTVPCVAIGGITPTNLPQLTAVGVKMVAVCQAVISTDDPAAACRSFLKLLG